MPVCRSSEAQSLALVNIFGGCIFGYNTGIISGLAKPLIQCTIYNDGDLSADQLSVYIVW